MHIKSINLRNMYSFGDNGTPDLKDFKRFNLFIGKNGSGKTNVLRAVSNLETTIKYNPVQIELSRNIRNKLIQKSDGKIFPSKTQKLARDVEICTNDSDIVFKDSKHKRGDLTEFKGKTIHVDLNKTQKDFEQRLHTISDTPVFMVLLSFSFHFIFDRYTTFAYGGVVENFINMTENPYGGGNHIVLGHFSDKSKKENSCEWSSGYFYCANIIIDFLLLEDETVICIDEPEAHVEPRVLKKLINILFWLCIINMEEMSTSEKKIGDSMMKYWSRWVTSYKDGLAKPYSDMDFNRDRPFLRAPFPDRQLFISSHSPVLINEFIQCKNSCNIYEFDSETEINSYYNVVQNPQTHQSSPQEQKGKILVSVVRKLKYPQLILDNLGAQGSDLLQTNGIIWVEGPSDVIYIGKWLEMYAREKNYEVFKPGTHFQFQIYGGALLDKYYMYEEKDCTLDEFDKIIDMFSFSRNSYVITDSDAKTEHGEITDASTFEKAKEYIENKINELINAGLNLGIWYEKGNTKIRTIEHYIPDSIDNGMSKKKNEKLLSSGGKGSKNKVENARRRIAYWNTKNPTLKLSEFNGGLEKQIKTLYDAVRIWNT